MKPLALTTVCLTLLLMGCGLPMIKTSWSKPGAQPGEYERDHAACDQDTGQPGLQHGASYDVCMQRKGWFLIEERVN